MKPFFFSILLLVSIINALGQTQKDTLLAWQHYKKADSLLKAKKQDQSIALFEKALPTYEKVKNWRRVANIHNKISENQRTVKELEKALRHAKKAIEICENYLNKDHPERANAYDNLGSYYEKKAAYSDVLPYYQKALRIRKKIFPENHPNIAKSYTKMGVYCAKFDQHQNAITYFEKALGIYSKIEESDHIKIGKIYNNLGRTYAQMEQFNKALYFQKKSLEIVIKKKGADHLNTGYNYRSLGITYHKTMQLDTALEYLEKALSIFKKNNKKVAQSKTYRSMGVTFGKKGEKDNALQYFKKSLELTKQIYGDVHTDIALTYQNMGVASNSTKETLFYYKKALEIFKKTVGENHSKTAAIYNNLGNIYREKRKYDTALPYYQKSLTIRQQIFNKNHPYIARSHTNIGMMYEKKGAYAKALKNCKKALAILQNSTAQNTYFLIHLDFVTGTIYQKQENYTKALSYFDKALLYKIKKNIPKTSQDIFDLKHYIDQDRMLFNLFIAKAYTLKERYKRDQKIQDLNQSIALYKNLDTIIDHLRLSYQNYNDKIQLAKKAKKIYLRAIETELTAYKLFNTPKSLEKAVYYAEKSKSNVLKDLLLDNKAKDFAHLPKEITALEPSLKSRRAFYQSQIVSAQSKDSVNIAKVLEYEGKILEINRRQDSLIQALEKEYPKYHQLKHQNNIITANSVQQKLDEKTTIVEFFTSDSITYAFTISKTSIAVKKITTPQLKENISKIHQAIVEKDNATYIPLAYDLHQQLIAPIQDKLVGDKLIIVPDGSLWHLNFDLLLTKKESSKDPKKLSYLLRDYAISYANSATLLFQTSYPGKNENKKQEECLAFSFSDTSSIASENMSLATLRDTGDDLPGTRKEIKAIANIIDGQYYYGSQATEQNFKKNTHKYKILHLALHGEVDHEKPENSKLYFTKSKDSTEDNLLYGHELLALDIPSELTVLSACNTGTGKIAKGEGIMSLGNAFQYAGTKSLLLSSWAISDETTPELMQHFYTNLKNGMQKPEALQKAKLQYLTTADFRKTAPFYWGGFYLVGDTNPILIQNTTYWYWGLGIVVLLVLLFLVIRNRMK